MQFNVGDSVVLKKDTDDGRLLKGATGIVVSTEYHPKEIGVFWNEFTGGHSCGVGFDLTEGAGWFVDTDIVELLEEENE